MYVFLFRHACFNYYYVSSKGNEYFPLWHSVSLSKLLAIKSNLVGSLSDLKIFTHSP